MVARRVHRGMSKAQKEQIRRILVAMNEGEFGLLATSEKLLVLVDSIVAAKYERGYHSGYTRGQRNPDRELADDL